MHIEPDVDFSFKKEHVISGGGGGEVEKLLRKCRRD